MPKCGLFLILNITFRSCPIYGYDNARRIKTPRRLTDCKVFFIGEPGIPKPALVIDYLSYSSYSSHSHSRLGSHLLEHWHLHLKYYYSYTLTPFLPYCTILYGTGRLQCKVHSGQRKQLFYHRRFYETLFYRKTFSNP